MFRVKIKDNLDGAIETHRSLDGAFVPKGWVKVTAYDRMGEVKWSDEGHNLVTNEGEAHFLDVAVHNGTQVTAWNVGLFGALTTNGTLAETDTLGSWGATGVAEYTGYSEANRVTFAEGAVATGATPSVSNTGTPASFSITGTGTLTVGGAFLASTNTKGGTAGVLLAEKAFSGGDRTLSSGDTLKIEYTLTAGGA